MTKMKCQFILAHASIVHSAKKKKAFSGFRFFSFSYRILWGKKAKHEKPLNVRDLLFDI